MVSFIYVSNTNVIIPFKLFETNSYGGSTRCGRKSSPILMKVGRNTGQGIKVLFYKIKKMAMPPREHTNNR